MAGEADELGAKARGMAKGLGKLLEGQTGILRHLAQEHGEVSGLMERVRRSRDDEVREQIFPEVRTKLLAHAESEEQTFYPVLMRIPELEPLVERSVQQHRRVEELLGRLAGGTLVGPEWRAGFDELVRAVEEHVELEEQQIFPVAKEKLEASRRKEMLESYERVEEAAKARHG